MKRINPELTFVEVKNKEIFQKISLYNLDNPEDYIDTIEHGTFVAGIAAALTNNKTGIASAGYNLAYVVP
ncbi:hypothetical protein ACQKIW_31475 [Bacillus thuringiensis]|uniref:hypothetical protein n=1 Tax=Bacillus thuringiensis TaxID=1428 RepID=UPI003D084F6A